MSTAGASHTVAVDPAFDPSASKSFEELEQALEGSLKGVKARATEAALVRVLVVSRGGWVASMVEALLQEYPLSALAFLTHSGQLTFDDPEGAPHWATRLEGAYLDRAARELRELIGFIADHPELAARVDPGGLIVEEELADQLASPLTCEFPGSDQRVLDSDEGQGARLFVVWLKSILEVLETAGRRGLAVVHTVDEPF